MGSIWDAVVPTNEGMSAPEMIHQVASGKIRALYVIGETKDELGASAYYRLLAAAQGTPMNYGGTVPEKDAMVASNLTAVETRKNGGTELMDQVHQII